jgi:hypothetical protein
LASISDDSALPMMLPLDVGSLSRSWLVGRSTLGPDIVLPRCNPFDFYEITRRKKERKKEKK